MRRESNFELDFDNHLHYFEDVKNITELEPGIVVSDELPPQRMQLRITKVEANAIAKMISKTRCTEKASCLVLGIKYDSWLQWKQKPKNSSFFDSSFTRHKESAVDKLLTDIEDISDGDSSIKLKPDWRAKEFLLKVRAPERFNFTTSATPATVDSGSPILTESLRRAFAGPVIDIDTANVSNDADKHQTRLIENQTTLRPIPPRKPKQTPAE